MIYWPISLSVNGGSSAMTDLTIKLIDKYNNRQILALRFIVEGELKDILNSLRHCRKSGVNIILIMTTDVHSNLSEEEIVNLKEFSLSSIV